MARCARIISRSVIDETTAFGARVSRRLREDRLAWLTTVDGRGTPQPIPVWFLWDGGTSILIYSRPDTAKLRNISVNPRVSLNLDGNGKGGDIVVCLGAAGVSDDVAADLIPEYVEKYRGLIERNGWTPESFAADYAVPLRMTVTRIRGH